MNMGNYIKFNNDFSKNNFSIRLLRLTLILLFISCVFDPSNKLLGLKYLFFYTAWILFLQYRLLKSRPIFISSKLVVYLLFFVFIIPFFSIAYYSIINGDFDRFDGLIYFKPYLFLTILIILYCERIDLIKPAIKIISLLSVTTIILFILSFLDNPLISIFLQFASLTDTINSGSRTFGGVEFLMVDFQSSPLIVFPISYFAKEFYHSIGKRKFFNLILLFINIAAMFMGATRNNMLFSLLLPILVFIWYSKKKKVTLIISVLIICLIIVINLNAVQGMIDVEEPSNGAKITFVQEYIKLFSHWDIFLFGQGLGSYFSTSMRGFTSITELTYFEFIRRFGLVLSLVIFMMLFYPLNKLRLKKYYSDHYIFIAYFLYLIICFSNPFLMTSTGMLLLSLVLYKTFLFESVSIKINS
jgi:hypothetical protein